ncbi:MAG TPA: alpha/beta fold hydrolase [Thermoanaerobaculia bacterium]|nr:alpha/beta fold hydrolase [Thermoanaerobaculia bacterium]
MRGPLTLGLMLLAPPLAGDVGWQRLGSGESVLVSYGSDGGRMLYHFGDPPYAKRAPGGAIPGAVAIEGPYDVIERRFRNGSVTLSGTVFLPSTPGPHRGAVFIHGSGASTRDNFWYVWIADRLARNGIAVLLPDKRGSGKSGGRWEVASFHDFAADAAAAVAALRGIESVARDRIGVIGVSQGGHVAPMVPDLVPELAFVVNLSGSAVPIEEQLKLELTNTLRQEGWPRFLIPLVRPIAIRTVKNRRPVWWQKNGEADPIQHWRRLSVPALVVYGAEDEQDNVPVSRSVERLRAAGAGIDIVVYPDSGHALYAPGTKRIREDFLQRLVRWIHSAASEGEGGLGSAKRGSFTNSRSVSASRKARRSPCSAAVRPRPRLVE